MTSLFLISRRPPRNDIIFCLPNTPSMYRQAADVIIVSSQEIKKIER